MTRRRLLQYGGALVLIDAGSAAAAESSDSYPNHAIRLIVPLTPGAGVDNAARILSEKLRERLSQSVVVENRPGGNSIIGTAIAAKAPADGYTLLIAANAHIIVPLIATKLPYQPLKDFAPVGTVAYTPYALVVNADLPVKTVREFIEYAKARPGALNFGSSGIGAGSHIAGEVFVAMTGLKLLHVPYKGGGQTITELIGGQIQASWNTVNAIAPHVKAGRIKALAVSGEARDALLPDVPTFAEAGLPQYQERAWIGLFAPAATPAPIVAKLATELATLLRAPDTADLLRRQGLTPFISSPTAFAEMLRAQTEILIPVVKAANIRLEN